MTLSLILSLYSLDLTFLVQSFSVLFAEYFAYLGGFSLLLVFFSLSSLIHAISFMWLCLCVPLGPIFCFSIFFFVHPCFFFFFFTVLFSSVYNDLLRCCFFSFLSFLLMSFRFLFFYVHHILEDSFQLLAKIFNTDLSLCALIHLSFKVLSLAIL